MTWIATFTGKQIHLWDPLIENIDIKDIAHALSNLCRYAGHCYEFYSVAQHLVILSRIAEEALMPDPQGLNIPQIALLHDAAEAYLGDVTTPLKAMLPEYKRIEAGMDRAISLRFNIPYPRPQEIKILEQALLLTETKELMGKSPEPWRATFTIKPYDVVVNPWSPCDAEERFLKRFDELWQTSPGQRDIPFPMPPSVIIDEENKDEEGDESDEQ